VRDLSDIDCASINSLPVISSPENRRRKNSFSGSEGSNSPYAGKSTNRKLFPPPPPMKNCTSMSEFEIPKAHRQAASFFDSSGIFESSAELVDLQEVRASFADINDGVILESSNNPVIHPHKL